MKVLTILRKTLATVCAFILFCLIVVIILLSTVKKIISKENIAEYINDSNVLELKANEFLEVEHENISEDSTIEDVILIKAKEAQIPDEVVNDLIESNELNVLLGDFIKGIIEYAIIDEEKPTLSEETINNLVLVASDSLESHIGIVMEQEELKKHIEEYISGLNDIVLEKNDIIIDNINLDIVKKVFTFNANYIYLAILILTILISLILWNWYYPIKYLGISITLAGLIFTIIGSLEWIIYGLIKEKFLMNIDLIHPILNKILRVFFEKGVFYTAIGIFLIVIFIVINRFHKNKKELEKKDFEEIKE